MEKKSFDKIRILLVDDLLPGIIGSDIDEPPRLGEPYSKYFQFRWLATPPEACEFRNLSLAISRRAPEVLATDGWIPEIISVDYALTNNVLDLDERLGTKDEYEILSPLPALRKRVRTLDVEVEPPNIRDYDNLLGPVRSNDFWGCYIGGLIFSTFSDHPCGIVTVTRYSKENVWKNSPDVGLFEWLMTFESGGLLRAPEKPRPAPTWDVIINDGVSSLRNRIKQLAKYGIITIHLDDLLLLSHNKAHPVLTFSSRYSMRRLPVEGLFIDVVESKRREAAKDWANDILTDALDYLRKGESPDSYIPTIAEIEQGRTLALQLREKWKDVEGVVRRMAFSRYLGTSSEKRGKPPFQLNEDEFAALQKYRGQRAVDIISTGGDIRNLPGSKTAKRWAVLFTITRLACIAWKMRAEGDEFNLLDEDVYLALFPQPETVPFYLHTKPGGDKTQVIKVLKRSVEPAIRVSDILRGKGWVGGDKGPYGLFPFERRILQMFAASLGCSDWQWARDPVSRNHVLQKILLGDTDTATSEE